MEEVISLEEVRTERALDSYIKWVFNQEPLINYELLPYSRQEEDLD